MRTGADVLKWLDDLSWRLTELQEFGPDGPEMKIRLPHAAGKAVLQEVEALHGLQFVNERREGGKPDPFVFKWRGVTVLFHPAGMLSPEQEAAAWGAR